MRDGAAIYGSRAEKIWACQKKENGTYRISAYKGEETEVVVPAKIGSISVTEIGKAWNGNHRDGCITNVRKIVLPEGFETIGYAAFQDNEMLEEIVMPETITHICDDAFKNCTKLKEVHVPPSVKKIGYRAFQDCRALAKVCLPEGVEEIGERTFKYCKNLREIKLPNTLNVIGSEAFGECSSLEKIVIPEGVKYICAGIWPVFNFCPKLTIYCRAKEKPAGWAQHIGGKNIVWGYKGD